MRLLEERFEHHRIEEDLRYDNLIASVVLQDKDIVNLKDLLGRALDRIEQLEVEAKVHPLKKLLKIRT
jgi:hypothetical protein